MYWLVLLLTVSGVTLAGDAEDAQALADANTEFAWDMYKKITAETDNIIFSPYSISTAMAMTSSGAQGETFNEMYQALKYSNMSETQVFDKSQKLIKVLNSNSNEYNISVANKLYGEETFTIKQPFLDQLRDSFDTTLEKTDFINKPNEARQKINEWVEDVTNDKIKDLLKEGTVSQDTRLYIVNAIYFGAIWKHQFKSENNMPDQDFHLSNGGTRKVTMMSHNGTGNQHGYGSLPDLKAKVLELPYTDYKVSMYIIMPDADSDLATLESQLTADHFKNSNNDNIFGKVSSGVIANVRIPKFEMTLPIMPKKMLSQMGVFQAFTSSANFSRISDTSLMITDVVHKAFINVHEAGTEAAAATGFGISITSLPTQRVDFFADRPFIYLIRERTTGTILFMGRYVVPPTGAEIGQVGQPNYQVVNGDGNGNGGDPNFASRVSISVFTIIFSVLVKFL